LMGIGPRDGIRQAMSHPQALGQCRHWLKAHGIEPVSYPDTAGAAAKVAELANPTIAALAPPAAAALYGLDLLATDIADADHNTTRFVTLARGGKPPAAQDPAGGDWMTTLIFEVRNVPAALYKAMGGFATKFYADVVGKPGDANLDHALEELGFHSKWLRVLGTYRQARTRG
jgi:prephenate dehydratase